MSGTGTVSTVTVNPGGTLESGTGSASGTLTVKGSLMLNSGADYLVAVANTTGTNSAVGATTTANIAGIVSVAAGSGTYSASNTYSILTGDNRIERNVFRSQHRQRQLRRLVPYLKNVGNSVQLDLTAGTAWTGSTSTGGAYDWSTSTNWFGSTVPTASSSTPANTVATFGSGVANTTVTINSSATAAALLFTSGAPSYAFNINGGGSLTLSGVGIDVNTAGGAAAPVFTLGGANNGTLTFQNAATAGDANINIASGGLLQFQGNSSGGTSQLTRQRHRRR